MFGLQSGEQKKPKKKEQFFDLELLLVDDIKKKELFANLENKIQKIKSLIRSGKNKSSFDKYNVLLQGYNSAVKVLNRIKMKKQP